MWETRLMRMRGMQTVRVKVRLYQMGNWLGRTLHFETYSQKKTRLRTTRS